MNPSELIKNWQFNRASLKQHRNAHKAVFELDKALLAEYRFSNECLLRYEEIQQSSEQPIVIYVKNKSDNNQKVTIFGAAKNQREINFGNHQDIEITSLFEDELTTYQQILTSTIASPFASSYIKLSGDAQQVKEPWLLSAVNLQGCKVSNAIVNESYFSPNQVQEGVIELTQPLIVDGLTEIKFTMLKNSRMAIYIYPDKIVSSGDSSAKQYADPILSSVLTKMSPFVSPARKEEQLNTLQIDIDVIKTEIECIKDKQRIQSDFPIYSKQESFIDKVKRMPKGKITRKNVMKFQKAFDKNNGVGNITTLKKTGLITPTAKKSIKKTIKKK